MVIGLANFVVLTSFLTPNNLLTWTKSLTLTESLFITKPQLNSNIPTHSVWSDIGIAYALVLWY